MNYGDTAWRFGRIYMGMPARLATRARAYGLDRFPGSGGAVLAVNHLHWVDIPIVGSLSPRTINFVAKIEAHRVPGLGKFIRWHGTVPVRRGESDREAVRLMRQTVRDGRLLGVFVEGTRQKTGRPGTAQPGAAMVAIQEDAPVIPAAVYGTQFWRVGNFAACSVAFGHPLDFGELPKNGRGYKEATQVIERTIHHLFDWLADVHASGRPKDVTPP
jgi:1-acyl-sn-glycerol-3-phosphate acyltransferase